MRSVYEIGPDFELSPKVLEFEKICWNWNRKVLQWEEPSSNPHQRTSITKKTKKIKIKIKTDTEGSL
jgi:hypothetical protein